MLTYKTVVESRCQQPLRMTINNLISNSDVIDDVTRRRRRRSDVVVGGGRSTDVESQRTHTLHCTSATMSLSDVIKPHAPETGCDVTRPVVLVTRRVDC